MSTPNKVNDGVDSNTFSVWDQLQYTQLPWLPRKSGASYLDKTKKQKDQYCDLKVLKNGLASEAGVLFT